MAATYASGWASTRARHRSLPGTTSGSRSTARPVSARPPTVARSSSPKRRARWPESRGPDIGLRDLGEHHLKDFGRPERLYQVEAAGLETTFPALRTLDLTPNNLPPQLTSFVGRAEVDKAVTLLDRTRLLTLTGPGGTGKTRLCAGAGERLRRALSRTARGSCRSRRSPTPELVASAIAASLGLLDAAGAPRSTASRSYLRDRSALLVLDNFEQVVAGGPGGRRPPARGARRSRSSRPAARRCASRGEQEFPVPPLSLPVRGSDDPATLTQSEAVRLFVERAMAVRPDFTLTPENGAAVAEIVRRLDGLPLAIELAAARIRLLSPAAMAHRLGDRLDLGAGGARDLPERQRTLRGAIDWSHDLLDPEERRCSRGSPCSPAAGRSRWRTPCAGSTPTSARLDVLGGIERLAEQSLARDRRGHARRHAVHDARDDPRVRARAARGARRDRRVARAARDGIPGVRGDDHRAGLDHRRGVKGAGAPPRPPRGRARQPPHGARVPDRDRRHGAGVGARGRPVALLAPARPHRRGARSRGPRPRDAGLDRRADRGPAACPRGRRRARVLGRRPHRRRTPLRGGDRGRARPGGRRRGRQRPVQPLLRPPSDRERRGVDRADARRGPVVARRGARDLDAPRR